MANFAQIDGNNVVLQVLVVDNAVLNNLPFPESEPLGIEYLQSLFPGTNWLQTSYNNNFRVRYCGPGDAFYPNCTATPYGGFGNTQPYSNWIWDDPTCMWIPPVPYPTDGKYYLWNQELNTWVLAPNQPPTPPTVIG
jgi:hypothetical protein